jgi:outer membrane protein assembly factor BamB
MKPLHFALVFGWLALVSLATASAQVPSQAGDWPQWRGPNGDGISLDKNLLKEWPENGPPVVWQVDTVGVGYSSLSVKAGRIFTQGDIDGVEHIIALDAKDGRTLWAVQPGPLAEILTTRIAADLKQIDKNGDGTVSEAEALARFGWDWNKYEKPSDEPLDALGQRRAKALFNELDKDADGQLSYSEAGSQLRDTFEKVDLAQDGGDVAAIAQARASKYLAELDKDGDGRISKQESRGTALDRNFGRFDSRDPATNKGDELLSADEITTELKKSQAGRDAVLTLAELEKYFLQTKVAGDGILTADELRGAVGGYRNGMGDGPRGTPTIDGDRLFAEGGNGDVSCLDAATGKTIWHVNLKADFGGNTPGWGYSESPLVVGDLLIVTPGGKLGTLLALDKHSGKPVWQSKEVSEGAHYSTPVLAEIGGIKQVVQFSNKSVIGVALEDGKPLWSYAAPANGTANCCSPIVDGDLVFASSGYGTGGGLAKIIPAGSTQQAEEVYFEKKMACHHGGMVKVGDYIYSAAGGSLICMEFDSGKIMWQARSAGKGSLCVADGMLYLLGEKQEVALAEATPEAYREHGRFRTQSHGRPSWAHPVVTGGRLYIRDQDSLTAYDVRAK